MGVRLMMRVIWPGMMVGDTDDEGDDGGDKGSDAGDQTDDEGDDGVRLMMAVIKAVMIGG